MFCKVVFDKIVHLASWEDTQFGGVFYFWNGNLLHLNICGTHHYLSIHKTIIIMLFKFLVYLASTQN